MLHQAIHLYAGLFDAVDTQLTRATALAMLAPDEMQRADGIHSDRKRRHFVLAHALVRAALSCHVPAVAPAAWSLRADVHGRPHFAGPIGTDRLYFSLSHTEGCVACVIAPCEAVGVDVEHTDRAGSVVDIAEAWFSAAEVAALHALPSVEQADRFFDYWTLKEAYIKARGLGMRLPLDRFSMILAGGHDASIECAPDIDADPERWRFARYRPSPRHRLAVADGSGWPGGLAIVEHAWPLALSGG